MDSILNATSILDEKNWLYFKLYKNPSSSGDWKSNMDWYHQVLIDMVKPMVVNTPQIRVVFFGFYGPTVYDIENEKYERQITPPTNNVVYMRLRFSVKRGSKRNVRNTLTTSIKTNRNLVWDYEIMRTYHVRNDLGNRYGSNLDKQTLQFVRYWDAACRYLLSIFAYPHNWISDVDVWGIPHLVNNSLGGALRLRNAGRGRTCTNCGHPVYLITGISQLASPVSISALPCLLAACKQCGFISPCSINI